MHIDYADVLRQAVQNERVKVLRELEELMRSIPMHNVRSGGPFAGDERRASQFKHDLERGMRAMWPS